MQSSALLALALTVPLAAAPEVAAQDPLKKKEIEALVREYFELDGKTETDRARQDAILTTLESVPFPKKSDLRRWDRFFAKCAGDRRKIDKEPGEYRFWEDEHRGRYFVGGETKKPTALFLGMHGGGEGSGDAGSSHGAYTSALEELGWLGIFPEVLEKTEHGWTDSGTEEFVLELVEAAARTWKIDPDRVYFGGHSMGGYGSWVLGAHHADRVAALLPSAGAPSPVFDRRGNVVSIQDGVIPNLRNVPMCVFQSTDDPQVGPKANQAAVREVEKARKRWGGYEDFDYWEVSDRQHGYPEGGVPALLDRIDEHVRDPRPTKVVWQPALAWKRQFYWLWWASPDPRATVIAEIDSEKNQVDVELRKTRGEGLYLLLGEELVDLESELTVYVGGERVFRDVPAKSFATLVTTAAHGDPKRRYVARVSLETSTD